MYLREQTRFEANQPVNVTVLGKPDTHLAGHILNVSRSGMCLAVDQPVPNGAKLNVAWQRHFLVGTARYQARENRRYVIGVELLTCSAWRGSMKAGFLPLRLRSLFRKWVSGTSAGGR